ncbi:PfkB family carbohydrate kinase [uncultured Thiohalocapsa sp.]|uniref:PfkB family carbohydrate kinase n=1 Tax=uncultured Thiohalocapsa sp. TaxID=768990 RepID=UPI0025D71843|nr:PfkB family carbohydrate kinase [uncultured Thiohalocapsa sp.]
MPAERGRGGGVLGVGIATLDIINRVAAYPAEDAEVRALSQRRARGGNCANTLDVLAQLGHPCAWVGVLAADRGADFIVDDLTRRGIAHHHARRLAGGATPTSYIALSRASGSRTIVHHRDLPELDAADFARVPLADWDWAHFEGRNPVETAQMLRRVRRERPDLPISVEIEKPRDGIERLFGEVDVLIVARAYAQAVAADTAAGPAVDPARFLRRMTMATGARLCLLPWGSAGAYALAAGAAAPVFAPAQAPAALRDSLAAGDVFNAAIIDALLARGGGRKGLDTAVDDAALAALLARANRLAGCKCGRDGLDGLVAAARAAGWPDDVGA